MATFQSLYDSRCVNHNGKSTPIFWKPQPVKYQPLTLFSDDSCPCEPDWQCEDVISRIIALGLHCEIPVGEFVQQAGKRDLPDDPILPVLLRSHVADEAAHDLGFRLIQKVYPVSEIHLAEAQAIAKEWQSIQAHPIVLAAALEVGVFLASLGALRLFGGNSLSHVAANIAMDEFRHVAVNMAVMLGLGLEFTMKILKLIEETVSYIFENLSIPESETGMTVDREFFLRASHELVHTGHAADLDSLIIYTNHYVPFELSNKERYSRSV